MNDTPTTSTAHPPARRALMALLLTVPVPILCVLGAMVIPSLAGTTLGKGIYIGGKVWIVLIPTAWWFFIEKGRFSLSRTSLGSLGVGAWLGAVMFGTILGVYWWLGGSLLDAEQIRTEATANGIGSKSMYLTFAILISLTNALMEEYIWRWFVLRQCLGLLKPVGAVLLSAVLFTLHHVIALQEQMGWQATLLASAGCMAAGIVWSAMYLKYKSIWPSYISHVLADAAIFLVGWWLIFGNG